MLLGHSSLDVVKRYARVSEIDTEQVHRKASRADNRSLYIESSSTMAATG
jgi:integrase/recombinase XerD